MLFEYCKLRILPYLMWNKKTEHCAWILSLYKLWPTRVMLSSAQITISFALIERGIIVTNLQTNHEQSFSILQLPSHTTK